MEIKDSSSYLFSNFLLNVPIDVLSNFVISEGVLDAFSGEIKNNKNKEKPVITLHKKMGIFKEDISGYYSSENSSENNFENDSEDCSEDGSENVSENRSYKKLVIKNYCFKGGNSYTPDGEKRSGINMLFKIESDVVFENCEFENEAGLGVCCGKDANVTFRKCVFHNLTSGIETLENSNVLIENCTFSNISFMNCNFCDKSGFKIIKTKFLNLVSGVVMTIMDNSAGTIEESVFKGINCNFDQDLLGIVIEDKGKLGVYKTTFSKLPFGVGCGGDSDISLIECVFDRNLESIMALDNTKLFISGCKVQRNFSTSIFLKDNSDVKIFESEVFNNKKNGVQIEGESVVRIYDSSFYGNYVDGIRQSGKSDLVIQNSDFFDNKNMGLFSNGENTGTVSHSRFFNNKGINAALMGNGDMLYEDSEFYYKDKCKEVSLFCFYCNDNSKAHFKDCMFHSINTKDNIKSDTKTSAFIVAKNAEIFASGCSFEKLKAVAATFEKSQLYMTDSYVDDLSEALAFSDGGDSKVSNYSCNFGNNFDFLKKL